MSLDTEQEALIALRKRYPPESHAFFPQIADKTGANHNRRADAVVMGLWPSRGLLVQGFEVKVTASDLRKELETPEKAEEIARYCDKWWLVLGDRTIMDKVGLIPENWGVLAPEEGGTKLEVVQRATKLEPDPLERPFIASMLRCAQKEMDLDDIEPEDHYEKGKKKGFEEGYAKGLERMQSTADEYKERFQELKSKIDDFESELGMSLSSGDFFDNLEYDAAELGRVVKRVMAGGVEDHRDEMKAIKDRAESIYKTIEQELSSHIYGTELEHDDFEERDG